MTSEIPLSRDAHIQMERQKFIAENLPVLQGVVATHGQQLNWSPEQQEAVASAVAQQLALQRFGRLTSEDVTVTRDRGRHLLEHDPVKSDIERKLYVSGFSSGPEAYKMTMGIVRKVLTPPSSGTAK